MGDSTEASQDRIDLTGVAPGNGDRVSLERINRQASPTFDWSDDPQLEHTSALIKNGALKQAKGLHAEAEAMFREALDIGERVLRPDDPRLLPALSSLACAYISRGVPGEAEPLVTRLLAISESNRGQDHPDLVIILNDLTRVCLRQAAHGMAESVLLRLAAIKRAKGEDHPEVATVLASLAVVRQALGRHESAEQLWRRVLAIRERTLAPNHFALATTLEHLGEACAARGKIGESLQVFRRAQAIRELTLGPDHASVRTARERIADLQLQGSDDSLDSQDSSPGVSPPDGFYLPSAIYSSITPPARQFRDVPAPGRPRRGSRKLERPVPEPPTRADDAILVEPVAPVAEQRSESPRVENVIAAPYADVLQSPRYEAVDSDEADEETHPIHGFVAWSVHHLWKRRVAAIAATGVAAAFIFVMASDSRAWSEVDEPVTEEIPARQQQALASAPVPALPNATVGATEPPKASPVLSTASSAATPTRSRVVEQRSPARNDSERRTAQASFSIPTVSSALMAGFDSALRSRPDPLRGVGTPVAPDLPPVTGDAIRLNPVERDESATALQRPRLIGTVPTPHSPNQLVDVRGEVRVRFDVDTSGRPVMSSLAVVNSPHMLLTAEVLKLIPGLRFEPARAGGPEGKPIKDAVQLAFQFGPRK